MKTTYFDSLAPALYTLLRKPWPPSPARAGGAGATSRTGASSSSAAAKMRRDTLVSSNGLFFMGKPGTLNKSTIRHLENKRSQRHGVTGPRQSRAYLIL